jgi:hypothetical protein
MNSPRVNRPGLQKGSWSSDKQKGPGHQTGSLNIAADLCLHFTLLDLNGPGQQTRSIKGPWASDQVKELRSRLF